MKVCQFPLTNGTFTSQPSGSGSSGRLKELAAGPPTDEMGRL